VIESDQELDKKFKNAFTKLAPPPPAMATVATPTGPFTFCQPIEAKKARRYWRMTNTVTGRRLDTARLTEKNASAVLSGDGPLVQFLKGATVLVIGPEAGRVPEEMLVKARSMAVESAGLVNKQADMLFWQGETFAEREVLATMFSMHPGYKITALEKYADTVNVFTLPFAPQPPVCVTAATAACALGATNVAVLGAAKNDNAALEALAEAIEADGSVSMLVVAGSLANASDTALAALSESLGL